jgi:hypothetical protein
MKDLNEAQDYCYRMLCYVVGGAHHVCAKIKPCSTNGIEVNIRDGIWATFDSDYLTKLVVCAHEYCVRVEISSSGPGRIKLRLHKREGRKGRLWQRHPTIEDAIKTVRRI